MDAGSSTAVPRRRRTQCVVLRPQEGDASDGGALLALLDERGWVFHEASESLLAMAELCLLDRIGASKTSWGLAPAEGLALVVCHRAAWPDLGRLLSAIERYVPKAELLCYEGGSLEHLGGRGAGEAPAAGDQIDARANREPPATESPLISSAEIAMLLEAHDTLPAGRGRPPGTDLQQ